LIDLLIAALRVNAFDAVGKLVKAGADVNAVDMYGSTPLQEVVRKTNKYSPPLRNEFSPDRAAND